jgi:hypothetical protein
MITKALLSASGWPSESLGGRDQTGQSGLNSVTRHYLYIIRRLYLREHGSMEHWMDGAWNGA